MPSSFKLTAFLIALTIGVSAVPPLPAIAQSSAQLDRDAAEVKNYKLSMAKVRQLAQAGEAMLKARDADPRYKARLTLQKEIEALEKKEELSEAQGKRLAELQERLDAEEARDDDKASPQTLDEMVKEIEREPAIAAAIRNAGLTPREYSVMSFALFQSMMAHELMKTLGGKDLPKESAASLSQENMRFVAENEAEINRLTERLRALDKRP